MISNEVSNYSELAIHIISSCNNDKHVREICSEDFIINPMDHMITLMIERGVGKCSSDDCARANVMGFIPGFLNSVNSPDYLKSFACKYFANHPNKDKIMEVFERSLNGIEFKKDMDYAVKQYRNDNNYIYVEKDLRSPLTIFRQAENLKEYEFPQRACLE